MLLHGLYWLCGAPLLHMEDAGHAATVSGPVEQWRVTATAARYVGSSTLRWFGQVLLRMPDFWNPIVSATQRLLNTLASPQSGDSSYRQSGQFCVSVRSAGANRC